MEVTCGRMKSINFYCCFCKLLLGGRLSAPMFRHCEAALQFRLMVSISSKSCTLKNGGCVNMFASSLM